jgi:hypothetical protein
VHRFAAGALAALLSAPALASAQTDDGTKPTRPGSPSPALMVVPFGGVHTASGDTATAPPPLGLVGLILGYELPIGGSPWALAIQAQFASATEDPGRAFAYFMPALRLAYHLPLGDRQSFVPWASFGLGLAGYDVNTFGINGQIGADFMFNRVLGLGAFADFTGLTATDREDFGILDLEPFDGALASNFGGRIILRFGLGAR